MGKHISHSLNYCCHVMSSDEDQPIIMDIYAGFNRRDELTISVELSNYDEPWYNASTAAIVNVDDAHDMAKRHKIKYENLPCFIYECMEDWREIINPDLRRVMDCFNEIMESLLDEGCRFRIKRTYGKWGYMCC